MSPTRTARLPLVHSTEGASERRHIFLLSLIFVFGILAAVICFGLLKSQASVDTGYSIGGAFAGAVITWGVLTSTYLQLRRSSGELEKLRDRAEELQQKLIRGSPRPSGFEIEVDEHQRLILARPDDWEPRGGTIFDFQSPSGAHPPDIFPARFRAYYSPIPQKDEHADVDADQAAYYRQLREGGFSTQEYLSAHSTEIIHLGDPPTGIRSLRFTSQAFARVWRERDPFTGRTDWQFQAVARPEFVNHVQLSVDHALQKILGKTGDAQERAETVAEHREPLTTKFLIDLERGACDPRRGLSVEIERYLRTEHPLGSAAGAAGPNRQHDEEGSSATATALQGAGQDDGPQAQVAARRVDAQEDPSIVELVEVIPVGRVLVVCYHGDLHKIFFFELVDNAADYTTSSERFNRIISSVRFLS